MLDLLFKPSVDPFKTVLAGIVMGTTGCIYYSIRHQQDLELFHTTQACTFVGCAAINDVEGLRRWDKWYSYRFESGRPDLSAALPWAASRNALEAVQYLVSTRPEWVDPPHNDVGKSALKHAIHFNHTPIANILIKRMKADDWIVRYVFSPSFTFIFF